MTKCSLGKFQPPPISLGGSVAALVVGTRPLAPLLKKCDCQSRDPAPVVHAMLQRLCPARQSHDIRSLEELSTLLGGLPPKSFFTTLVTSGPEVGEPAPESQESASSWEICVSEIEEVLHIFRPPTPNVPS